MFHCPYCREYVDLKVERSVDLRLSYDVTGKLCIELQSVHDCEDLSQKVQCLHCGKEGRLVSFWVKEVEFELCVKFLGLEAMKDMRKFFSGNKTIQKDLSRELKDALAGWFDGTIVDVSFKVKGEDD